MHGLLDLFCFPTSCYLSSLSFSVYLQVVWVATFIFTVLFNPDLGLAAAIGFSMLTVIFRTQL